MVMGGKRHAPAALPPGKRPGTHCTGGWVGSRAGLDRCRNTCLHEDSISGPSSPYRVAIPTRLSWATYMPNSRFQRYEFKQPLKA
jgi:hypothetical protein